MIDQTAVKVGKFLSSPKLYVTMWLLPMLLIPAALIAAFLHSMFGIPIEIGLLVALGTFAWWKLRRALVR